MGEAPARDSGARTPAGSVRRADRERGFFAVTCVTAGAAGGAPNRGPRAGAGAAVGAAGAAAETEAASVGAELEGGFQALLGRHIRRGGSPKRLLESEGGATQRVCVGRGGREAASNKGPDVILGISILNRAGCSGL